MKIEIWSDIACPYCYIGKRKLETALSDLPGGTDIEIVWHAYELDPSLSLPQVYPKYLAEKLGMSDKEAAEYMGKITALAKETGLDYNLDKLVVARTFDALRLTKLAEKYGIADRVKEELFKAYFTIGKNISERNVLIDIGKSCGILEEEIIQMLNSDMYSDEIKNDMDLAENELDLEYIPFYLINGKHILQGSASVEDYKEILNAAYTEPDTGGEIKELRSGPSCSVDGVCEL